MKQPDPDPLEAWVDAELNALPPLTAPATLAPRVLNALQSRAQRPWWRAVWWEWPRSVQAVSLVLALALAAAFSSGGVLVDEGLAEYWARLSEALAPAAGLWETMTTLWGALGLLWEGVGQPTLVTGLVVAGGLYLLCIGLGTAVVRSAFRRA